MLAKSPRQGFLGKKNVSLPLGLGMMVFFFFVQLINSASMTSQRMDFQKEILKSGSNKKEGLVSRFAVWRRHKLLLENFVKVSLVRNEGEHFYRSSENRLLSF